jgi:hypothetical protein
LGKKSASRLNTLSTKYYKFIQRLLPLFSTDATRINNLAGFFKRKGMVSRYIIYYFIYQLSIYHHCEDYITSFKICPNVLMS